jgi:thiol-disulfide isomerase/thioredoxin
MQKRDIAIALAALILSISPAIGAPPSYQQAVADYNAGKFALAASKLQTLKAAYPSNALTRYYLGLSKQALGQINEARSEYQWVSVNGDEKLRALATQGLQRLIKVQSSTSTGPAIATNASSSSSSGQYSASSSSTPVSGGKVKKILKFYAFWCVPCRAFAPIFDATKPKYPDIQFESLNIDQPSVKPLQAKYHAEMIPTVVLLDGNDKVLWNGGAVTSQSEFVRLIETFR